MPYFVYLLQCSDNSYYCGYTTDLKKRLEHHNTSTKGAKYTRTKRPTILKYFEKFATLSGALKREYAIKQLSHLQKETLAKRSTIIL